MVLIAGSARAAHQTPLNVLMGVRCASALSDGVPCGDFSLDLKERFFLPITMSSKSFPAQGNVLLN